MIVIYQDEKFILANKNKKFKKHINKKTRNEIIKIFGNELLTGNENEYVSKMTFNNIYYKSLQPNIEELKNFGLENIINKRNKILSLQGNAIPKINLKFNPRAGTPTSILALFKHDEYCLNMEKAFIYEQIYDFAKTYNSEETTPKSFSYEDGYNEILAKKLIYRELKEGILIPYPKPNSTEIEFYEVKKSLTTGKGMTCNLLLPANKKSELFPRLFFCGSKFYPSGLDAISHVIASLEYELGKEAYQSGQSELESMIKEFKIKNESLIVSGHSLGGNLAQQFTAKYYNIIKELITFNSPGIKATKDILFTESILQSKRKNPLLIKIIRNAKDLTHCTEEQHLGLNYLEKQYENKLRINLVNFYSYGGFYKPHTYCNITNPLKIKNIYKIISNREELIKKLKNHHKFVELLRSRFGNIISKLLIKLRKI